MDIVSGTSRSAALILSVTVAVVGWSLPASAEDDRRSENFRRGLTVNGQPFSQFIARTAPHIAAVPLTVLPRSDSGQIVGVALRAEGQPLTDHAVELWRLAEHAQPTAATFVTDTTTDRTGRFSFERLPQGRYAVEVEIDGRVIATREPIALAAGGITFVKVGGANPPPSQTNVRTGKGAAFWSPVGAGAGGALGLVMIAGADCELSENLCPLPPMMGAMTGALMGLMFGVAR